MLYFLYETNPSGFERFNGASSILYASVQDVRPATVEIDFAHGTLSCNCPQLKWCRHQVGALLALYQYFDSVQNWSGAWRAQKSVQLKSLADERSPESWQLMVDEVMKRCYIWRILEVMDFQQSVLMHWNDCASICHLNVNGSHCISYLWNFDF
ncbi:hypothetical protein LSPH24S_06436 [Lysinibacillus sphaericus]